MSKSAFLTFLLLQRERIIRLGRMTPHASGVKKPSLADQDSLPDPLESDTDD